MAIKKLIIRGIILLILCVNAHPSLSNIEDNYSNCSEFTNSEGAITFTPNAYQFCRLTPDVVNIIVYYVGLCREQPSVQNFRSVCSPLLDIGAGKEVSLSLNSQTNLVDEVSLSEGNYPYAVILLDNYSTYSIKKKFSPARTGKTGTGEWCWTLDETLNSFFSFDWNDSDTWTAECGSTPPATIGTAVYSPNALYNDSVGGFSHSNYGSTDTTTFTSHLLLSD